MHPKTRRLAANEIGTLLAADVPARLATLDQDGYPRITPIWFVWEEGAFWMTSLAGQPHLRNLAADPRAAVCVDVEDPQGAGGVRANRQVKGRGLAALRTDERGVWTRRITLKYVHGPAGEDRAEARAAVPRVVISLRPERLTAIGTAVD